jgi:GntR family transcriptional regulator
MTPPNSAPRTTGADPLYRRVGYRILEQISSGALRRGDRLPSERALSEQCGVSRVTLRRALQQLEEDGVVASSRGSGWYVTAEVLGEPPNALLSFTEMARTRGLGPSAHILDQRVRPATLDESEALGIAPGAELLHLERLRLLNDVPIAFDHSLIPVEIAPSLPEYDFTVVSLYTTLELEYAVVPSRADYAVEAVAADERAAGLLDVAVGAPTLVTTQTTYESHDRPFELSTMTYRGDRYRFRASLWRHSGARGIPLAVEAPR